MANRINEFLEVGEDYADGVEGEDDVQEYVEDEGYTLSSDDAKDDELYDDDRAIHTKYENAFVSGSMDRCNIQWRRFYVAPLNMEIEVSNEGHMRYIGDYQSSTLGSDETGSPYRIFTIFSKTTGTSVSYYAHELVWVAFHGAIPTGWQVRHKSYARIESNNRYNNALGELDLYKKFTDPL